MEEWAAVESCSTAIDQFSISITQINPKSKGEIWISSNNKVQVNPNYLERE